MSKKGIRWKKAPEPSDYDGAARYLSLLFAERDVDSIIKALKRAKPLSYEAKDLLRASNLPLLSREDPKVAKDLQRIHKSKSIPPVLLVRANAVTARLIVADGYHRICALTLFDEDEMVECRLVDPPPPDKADD